MIISSTSGHACEDTQHMYPYMHDGHLLRLKFSQNVYELKTMTDGHGTLQATHTSGLPGDSVTLTPVPDPKYTFTGYQSTGCTINGNTLTFGAQDCTAKANFYKPTEKVLIGSFSGHFNDPMYDPVIAIKPDVVGAELCPTAYKFAGFTWNAGRASNQTLFDFITTYSADFYKDCVWQGDSLTGLNYNSNFNFNPDSSACMDLHYARLYVSATDTAYHYKPYNILLNGKIVASDKTEQYVEINFAEPLTLSGRPMFSISSSDTAYAFKFDANTTWRGTFYKYE